MIEALTIIVSALAGGGAVYLWMRSRHAHRKLMVREALWGWQNAQNERDSLQSELARRTGQRDSLQEELTRLTDRDELGRYKKDDPQ